VNCISFAAPLRSGPANCARKSPTSSGLAHKSAAERISTTRGQWRAGVINSTRIALGLQGKVKVHKFLMGQLAPNQQFPARRQPESG
jgi:hypothetical protein